MTADTDRRFENVDLSQATFRRVRLNNARLRSVDLTGVVMRDVVLRDVDISAELFNARINGVDIAPLVEAELDRRHPDRARMRPTDPAGFAEAWAIVERLWNGTVARARTLDPQLLHASVGGEWSFVQTLRHLVFATDAWVNRVILGDPQPWDPLDLPFDDFDAFDDALGILCERDARPSLDEVLKLREGRMAIVRSVIDRLTDEQLDSDTEPVIAPGFPEPKSYRVRGALRCVLNEEWEHRLYAERDLDALAPDRTGG